MTACAIMAGQEQTATYPQTVHHLVPMEFAMSLISVLAIMVGLDQIAELQFVILHVMVLVDAVTVLITAAVTRTGVGGCVIYHQVCVQGFFFRFWPILKTGHNFKNLSLTQLKLSTQHKYINMHQKM